MKIYPVLSLLLILGAALGTYGATPRKPPKKFLNLDPGQKPPGYTHVVTSPPGRMIFISGTGGRDAAGNMPEDFTSQAKITFENIGRCLKLAGAKFEDIVKINYFVTDLSHTAELRRIRSQYLNMDAPPASTLVQVGLGGTMLLEVEAIALVPE